MSARIVLCHLLLIVTLIGSNLLGLLPRGLAAGFVSEAHAASVSAFLDSEDFTFAAWVYWEGGEPWQRIFDFGYDTSRYMNLTPASGNGTLRFAITTSGAGGEEELNAPESLPTDEWVHVAVTLEGGTGQLYVDAVSVDNQTITLNPNDVAGSRRWLGKSQYAHDPHFDGRLDEVAVFNRALAQWEIYEIMLLGWDLPGAGILPALTLGLHMEENPATDRALIVDSSRQENHGRLVTGDGLNKSSQGKFGQALSFDGSGLPRDDYLVLPTTLYVRPGGSGDCLSWASACELQTALGIAVAPDHIWVAAGTYKPSAESDPGISFQLKNGVALYGGFPALGDPGWEVRDWGANPTSLSGDIGTVGDDSDNSYHVVTTVGFSQVSVGGFHTCGVQTDGNVPCWGVNFWDQAPPLLAGPLSQVSARGTHTCGVRTDGKVACWGEDRWGQATPPAGSFSQVSAGWWHTCGVRTDGKVACWGNDSRGQATPPAGSFSQVSAGFYHTCGVRTDGKVACWGEDRWGEATPPAGSFSQVSVGDIHTCGLKTDGNLACWGDDRNGKATPPAGSFSQVSASLSHTCGLKTDGNLACWGNVQPQDNPPRTGYGTRLDGFIITGGNANDPGRHSGGGGMVNSGSPTLANVIFKSNKATEAGGGMHNFGSDPISTSLISPSLINVYFDGNTADVGGGGMRNDNSSPQLTYVTFSGNTADDSGGGMHNYRSSPELTDVTFSGNSAVRYGGGIYNNDSNPHLTNVTFSGNTADDSGGGMHNYRSSPELTDVTFSGNYSARGGGMYNDQSDPQLVQSVFISNSATFGGGGMYNKKCSPTNEPTLANVLFNNNAATGTTGNEADGGGMYNEDCSPELTNVTFVHNRATQYGGGMANFGGSIPTLNNSVLWGNTGAGTVKEQQVYPVESSLKKTASTIQTEDQPAPFVDADGADNIPGTPDDDLHPGYPSYDIIDGGIYGKLPADSFDLDGDGDTVEKLPLDLDGHPRLYADIDLDGAPDSSSTLVDQGAYEAGCWAWHMVTGDGYLAEGRKYRLDFHSEIGEMGSSVTIYHTLASYAAERAARNLTNAKMAYELALECAATVTQTNQALLGIQNVIWEQATGAMLEGNEQMVQALDLTDAEDIQAEISALEEAIQKYQEATDGYMALVSGDYFDEFVALQLQTTDPLTDTQAIDEYRDVERLMEAVAKKSRASLDLAERQFRQGDTTEAELTLRQAKAQANVELALLYELWPGVVDEVHYQALLRTMSDMDRLLGFLVENKNPLGYTPEWVPIHYKPASGRNNYEETDELAKEKLDWANEDIADAHDVSDQVHDNYQTMQSRYALIEAEYDDKLVQLCGVDGGEPDLTRCAGGTIADQISAVEQAQLHLAKVLEEMDVLNKRIQIEVETKAADAGISQATAELINPDTSERYSSMGEQEDELETGFKILGAVSNIASGFFGGSAFGPEGAIAGGLLGGVGPTLDLIGGFSGMGEGPSKEEQLLEYQAWQNAQMLICKGDIKELEFERRIKELFLEFGLLDIDYLIALENLQQELLRLDAMKTRVEYLMAEKEKALAFTTLLYQDPAHRVLRDYYMELAQTSYDVALDYVFQAGRALEYEANLAAGELGAPAPDGMFGIRNIDTLEATRQDTKTAYDEWSADKNPNTYVTDTPYPRISLSRALGFEDTETMTREEQFNAFIRDPANRYDLDDDGIEESLFFSFLTSVHKGNPFFDHCLFNDRIKSIKMRVRGQDLGQTSITVRLGWGDVSCNDTDCGTTFIRSEEAFTQQDGAGYLDDLRAYKVQPKLATIQAVTGDTPFPENAANSDLATRSVASPYWTLFIDMTMPANQGFNLDNVDEIELIMEHEAYSLQSPMCQGPGTLRLASVRAYQPMQKVLDPQLLALSVARAASGPLTSQAAETSLTGLYAGTVVPASPEYMPALDLNLVMQDDSGGSLAGYVDAERSLNYPVVDQGTGHGPALSGSWSGDSFNMAVDPFTTTLDFGLTVTHSVLLQSGVISNTGELLSGQYSETITGFTPQPLEVTGVFTLWRAPTELALGANFTALPIVGTAPLTVTFHDLSSGEPTGWEWDFGDGGTSTEQHPSHTYLTSGSYTVTLTVSDTQGTDTLSKPDYISVLEPTLPTALFSASPLSGTVPLTVTFSDLSDGYPTHWSWTFGDGGTATAQNPVHTYVETGTFTVTLTVSNTQGTHTLTKTNYISVLEPTPPVALFSASPVSGPVPLTVNFSDQSSGFPTHWSWAFGDGDTATAQNPFHTYVETGTFTVTLTVSNTVGSDTMVDVNCVTVSEAGQDIYLPLIFKNQQQP